MGLQPQDLVSLRMDGINFPPITAVDQVLHHRIADLAVFGRSSNHSHRIGLHDAVHLPNDVSLLGSVATLFRYKINDDANVSRSRAIGRCKYRIEVHLGDLGKVADQIADFLDEFDKAITIHRLATAYSPY